MLERTPGAWSSGDKQGRLTVPRDLFGSLLQARLHPTQWFLIADNLAPNCLKSCQNNKPATPGRTHSISELKS